MGLNHALARWAVRHSHVLVVEVPGAWRTRAAVESAVLARGWRLAESPADADVLVVCGRPDARLAETIELVWHQMPGPRVRLDLESDEEVGARLDEARNDLLDTVHHRHDASHRLDVTSLLAEHVGQEGMDHGDGHEGMDHGDMEMSPGGVPLAEGGEDRDGLEMDVLKIRLGPVLPHWPAGLVLSCSLQGDVIVEARADLLGGGEEPDEAGGPARRLDNLSSFLALIGWDSAAAEARRLRDIGIEGEGGPDGPALERLSRRLRRSRTLRWSLRGVRPLSAEEAAALGLPADLVGDTYDRLLSLLDRTDGVVEPVGARRGTVLHQGRRTLSTDKLAPLVTGLDLATARLVLASLDVDDLQVGHAAHEVSHG